MDLRDFNLSLIKNKQVFKNLRAFIENLIQKKGQDISAMLLFGSLVKGTAKDTEEYQSDIDLLIISSNLPKNILTRKLYTAKLSTSLGCGIDELWHTPEEIVEIVNSHRAFIFEIIRDGTILFESNNLLTNLKESVEKILKEKNIKELKHSWIWPQKTPGAEIDW